MHRRAAVLLSCAALAVAGPAAPADAAPGAPNAGRALALAECGYRRHLLEARPDLATRFGVPGAELRLVPVTEATIARDGAWLTALAARLDSLDARALRPRELARLDTLRAHLALERAPYAARAWSTDPGTYLALVPGAILDVALSRRVSPCARTQRAAGRLAAVPEVLRSAEINLREAEGVDRDRAVATWSAALDSLRNALPAHLSSCNEPKRQAELVTADTLACLAVEHFLRFLARDLPDGAPGTRGP